MFPPDLAVMPEADETPMGSLSDEQLQDEVCVVAGHLTAGLCRFLLLVAELDRREAWAAWGINSCAHWLSWRCGIALGTARDQVRVARGLAGLPLTTAGFAAGKLSYAKVRALVRVATPAGEAELVGLARQLTASQLERVVSAFRSSERAALGDAAKRAASRYLRHRFDADGSMLITARVQPEDGALIIDYLEAVARQAAADASGETPDGPADGSDTSAGTPVGDGTEESGCGEALVSTPGEQAMADALVAMARAAADAGDIPGAGDGDRAHLLVHVDLATMADQGGRCHLDHGPAVPYATACRLGCEGTVAVLVEDDQGNPLHLGDAQHLVNRAQRRALWARDGGCRFPGCGRRRHLHAHHLAHWVNGGPTCIANLALLCNRHHHLVHEGGYSVSNDHGQLTFHRPDGTPIHNHPPVPLNPSKHLTAQNDQLGLTITPETPGSLGNGGRFDLGITIDGLWQLLHPTPNAA